MPKSVDTRRPCEVGLEHATIPQKGDVGRGLQKIVACSNPTSQGLLVSTIFGTVSSLYRSLTCFSQPYKHGQDTAGSLA